MTALVRAMRTPMPPALRFGMPRDRLDPLRTLIAQLFGNGEQGAMYIPQPQVLGQQVLFQDAAGTVPVTADGDPVGLMLDLSGNGNPATQSVSASRPIHRTDGTLHWLEGDGVDDRMLFSLPGLTGKPTATVCAAAKDIGSKNLGAMLSNVTSSTGAPGDILLWVPRTASSWCFRGNWEGRNIDVEFTSPPDPAVVTGQYRYDGSSPGLIARSQGAVVGQAAEASTAGLRGGDFNLFDRGTGTNAQAAFFGGFIVEGIPSPDSFEPYFANLAGITL